MAGFEDEQLARVEQLFEQLLEAVDRYHQLMQANLAHEQAAAELHQPRVALLKAQAGATSRLVDTLESTVLEEVIALRDFAHGPWNRAQFASEG